MHEHYLQQALKQAELRRGFCAPNPSVGAVLVKDDTVLAEGNHHACGEAHAEVNVLSQAGSAAQGGTMYVTLEPCCHHGRTPPCVDAIIKAGVKLVYYGFQDPNPKVAGQGEALLKAAGIACQHLPVAEIDSFYQSYAYWTQHRRPWVTTKLALSLDAKIAGKGGEPVAITGDVLKRFTHEQRKRSDALLSTVATVLADDPALNVRLDLSPLAKSVYLLDTHLNFPLEAKLLSTAAKITLFYSDTASIEKRAALTSEGIRCVPVASDSYGLSLNDVLDFVGSDGVHDLWVEAGAKCIKSFNLQSLVSRAYVYIAPILLGEDAVSAGQHDSTLETLVSAFQYESGLVKKMSHITWRMMGRDALCQIERGN